MLRGSVVVVLASFAAGTTWPRCSEAQIHARIRQELAPVHFAPPDTVAAHALAGCYLVSLATPHAAGTAAWVDALPDTLLLDTVPKAPPLPMGFWFVSRQLGGPHVPWFPIEPGWAPVNSDSIQVLTAAAEFHSTILFLHRVSDRTFRGTARHRTDVADHSIAIVAQAIPCPAAARPHPQ